MITATLYINGDPHTITATYNHPMARPGRDVWIDDNGQFITYVGHENISGFDIEIPEPHRTRIRLGLQLRHLRESKGLTYEDVAERTGYRWQTLRELERGAYAMNIDKLEGVVNAMGAHIDIVDYD